jgi:hypothetical protein
MYQIDKWIHFTRIVKSPTSLVQGPQELSLTVEGSIRRKPSPVCSSSDFSMDQEDFIDQRSLLYLHQAANSTSLEPSDHSTSSQAKISSMGFFYLSFV